MPFCRLYLPLSPELVERLAAEHTHLVGWRQASGAQRLQLFELETAIGAWPWVDPTRGTVARGLTLDLRNVHDMPFFVDLLNARGEPMTFWRADKVALNTPHITVVLASRMSVIDKGVIEMEPLTRLPCWTDQQLSATPKTTKQPFLITTMPTVHITDIIEQ